MTSFPESPTTPYIIENEKNKSEKYPNLAERRMKEWLYAHKYGFNCIDQRIDTFATSYRNVKKRPDFIVTIGELLNIAIDVKDRILHPGYHTFTIDEGEIRKFLNFEQEMGIPVWFAISNSAIDYQTRFFISLRKLQDCLPRKQNQENGEFFRIIKIQDCITIGHDDNLSKLITR